jgi:histidine ammonia-lyase
MRELAVAPPFTPSAHIATALAKVRAAIPFMDRDRAMDGDVALICAMVEREALL